MSVSPAPVPAPPPPSPRTDPSEVCWTFEPAPPTGTAVGVEVPVLATAIHAGHGLDPATAEAVALGEEERRREEDPGTERFIDLGVPRVLVDRSRFEVDLNRPREEAVYRDPDAAWGLEVWRQGEAPPEALERGARQYDRFYGAMEELLTGLEQRWGTFAVYDVHSYNHRRQGPGAPPADPDENPEINLGTGALGEERHGRWAPVVESFLETLRGHELGGPLAGRRLDVRENVKFQGGHWGRWIARRFPESACPLAIEVKKIYMDEWTGRLHHGVVEEIRKALGATLPGVSAALRAVGAAGRG